MTPTARRHGSYGIDAPYVPAFLALGATAAVGSGLVVHRSALLVWGGLAFLILGSYLYATRRGKFVVWLRLLRDLDLRGDERLLDLGCGRGAVLLLAAQFLPTGRAVGVDLWRSVDQSGNAIEATRRNAAAEGVTDRIELHTGDITALPFEDASFDIVTSSLVIHNIGDRAGRMKAIEEGVRVLRPGGRIIIADIGRTREYQARLTELGMLDVRRRGLGWRLWWGGPWVATHLVTATRPRG